MANLPFGCGGTWLTFMLAMRLPGLPNCWIGGYLAYFKVGYDVTWFTFLLALSYLAYLPVGYDITWLTFLLAVRLPGLLSCWL